jgi:hypothetical protein
MGLDTVELVIEVEKAFDIAILDADAERIATVGQLYEFVLAKLLLQHFCFHARLSGSLCRLLRRSRETALPYGKWSNRRWD